MTVRLVWMPIARASFFAARELAQKAGRKQRFLDAHNQLVRELRELETAMSFGDVLFNAKIPLGQVKSACRHGIGISFAILPKENVAFILKYHAVPDTWTDD